MENEMRKLMPGDLLHGLFRGTEAEDDSFRPKEELLKSRQEVAEETTEYILGLLSGKIIEPRLHAIIESEHGLGKSLVLKHIIKKCVHLKIGWPFLQLTITDDCGMESLYRTFSAVGYTLGLVKEPAILERYESSEKQKRNAIIEIIKKIEIIFIDDSDISNAEIWNYLSDVIEKRKLDAILVGSRSTDNESCMDNDFLKVFKIEQMNFEEAMIFIKQKDNLNWAVSVQEEECPKILKYNPVSLLLSLRSGVSKESIQSADKDNLSEIIKEILSALENDELYLLYQLSLCRKPLPIQDSSFNSMMINIMKQGLAEVLDGKICKSVILQPSIKRIIKQIMTTKELNISDVKRKGLRGTDLWKCLLHPKLQQLLSGAEEQKWPYIPEPWQFTDDVNEEDSYNLRDLLNMKNEFCSVVPMNEVDVLQECLYQALVDKDYREASAVVFLIDRYAFWKGDANSMMAIVDFIARVSPKTAIAPQIITRKARVRKNDGDLQGAGKILDVLIDDEEKAGNWCYRDHAEYLIIKAASIELKGNIFHGLGLWYEAASNFMDSTGLFRSFQKPDKKGLAAGLALLADTLQFMPNDDFKNFARRFQLSTDHPLLEAIKCVTEAAKYCVHTPLFYAKNKRQAAESSLAYARYLDAKENEEEKWPYLRNAAFEILEGMKCHTSINRLESREQYFEFVACVHRISQICRQLFKGDTNRSAEIFEKFASDLFHHYCSYPIKVKHDKKTISLINKVMHILELPELPWVDQLTASGIPSVKINMETPNDNKNSKLMAISKELVSSDVTMDHKTSSIGDGVYNPTDEPQIRDTKEHSTISSTSDFVRNIQNEATVISTVATTDTSEREIQNAGTRNRATLTSVEMLLESAGNAKENLIFREAETLITSDSVESNDTGYRSASTENTSELNESKPSTNENLIIDQNKQVKSKLLTCYTSAANETVEERNWRVESTAATLEDIGTSNRILNEAKKQRIYESGTNKVQKAIVWRYDPIIKQWNTTETMAFVGDKIDFGKCGGACRDAYNFEHLNQDDPYGKYVGKQYKLEKYKNNPKSLQQYKEDIICQNTARYYVTLFNQRLFDKIKDQTFSRIQFLPAVLLELQDVKNDPEKYFNVEPYMYGNFEKITNNTDHVTHRDMSEKDLLLAFSHFTYFESNGELLVVDIQGWTSQDKKGFHYLTDPQIHTRDEHHSRYGTGNLGQRGFDNFWSKQHKECNDICKALGLRRPFNEQQK